MTVTHVHTRLGRSRMVRFFTMIGLSLPARYVLALCVGGVVVGCGSDAQPNTQRTLSVTTRLVIDDDIGALAAAGLTVTDAALQSSASVVLLGDVPVFTLASSDDELVLRRTGATTTIVIPDVTDDDALSLRFVFAPGDDDSPLGAHTLLIRGTSPTNSSSSTPMHRRQNLEVLADADPDSMSGGHAESGDPDPSPAKPVESGDPDPSPAGGDPDPSPAAGDPDPSAADGDPDPSMAQCKDCDSPNSATAAKVSGRDTDVPKTAQHGGRASFAAQFDGTLETTVAVEPGTDEARVEIHVPAQAVVDSTQSTQTGSAARLNNVASSVVIEKQKY
jgi:hypothetical protein